jgi:uncharacterized protein with HEPN domain
LKHDVEYLKHIRDECEYILATTEKITYDLFIHDETLKRALVRSIEIIGEAAKNISPNFRHSHTEIDWKKMTGMRDVLIHGYFGVNYTIVWDVIINHIAGLYDQIQGLLAE